MDIWVVPLLAIVTSVSVNMHIQASVRVPVFTFGGGTYLGVELLDHRLAL